MPINRLFSRRALGGSLGVIAVVALGITQVAGASLAPHPAIEIVSHPATASLRAQRLSLTANLTTDSDKPIFPMEIEPRCDVLDNFGEARSGSRLHQGTDMLAEHGQDVYAVVSGKLGGQVVDGQPGSELSGNTWRLYSATTKTYYVFLHLAGFAPGLQNGSLVTQGQVIGYVGDTGNPGSGNDHLHFEVHPDGGAAVNALTVITIPKGCTLDGQPV